MELNPIKVKVTLIGDNFEISFLEDYTEYAKDLIECKNVFSDSGMPMTAENISDFFANREFTEEQVEKANGSHFIFGFLESLGQSDQCPEFLHSYRGTLRYRTERI